MSKPNIDNIKRFIPKSMLTSNEVGIAGVRGYFLDSMGKKGQNDRVIYDDAIAIVSPRGIITFNALQDPIVNIKEAIEQMRRQLKNTNTILLQNSSKYRYWAVLLHGNKYTKIPEVKARVLKYASFCK